jgi:hypothetical protein
MVAAVALGAGNPLPAVGALVVPAAGIGPAWTGGRPIPRN